LAIAATASTALRNSLAKKNEREATIWIEGSTAQTGGESRKRGINLCLDLSATLFYIQGSGNEVGKPFP
jgi:type III restriction enzyme